MNTNLPLVQLSLLRPFVEELQRRNLDAETIMARSGIPIEAVDDPKLTVHVSVVTQAVEDLAEAADDRFLAAKVGGQLNTNGWPPLVNAAKNAKTVGDFLTRFVGQASKVANSAIQYLRLEGDIASIGETRRFEPKIVPAQNDAFMTSLIMAILGKALGQALDPRKITIVVSNPKVLPQNYELMQIIKGNNLGYRILFPTQWLSTTFDWSAFVKASDDGQSFFTGGSDIVTDFRQILRSHLGRRQLTAVDAAKLAGMSRQKFALLLRKHETTISTELEYVRLEAAKEQLTNSDSPIAEIAEMLGFSNPANFSRTFTRAVGISPRAYRTNQRE